MPWRTAAPGRPLNSRGSVRRSAADSPHKDTWRRGSAALDTSLSRAVVPGPHEDQGGKPTLGRIRRRFGARVAEIVEGCSDADTVPKPEWRVRKERYLRHLETAPADVRLVSACDKLHNARAILGDYRVHGEAVWKRFKGGRDGTLWNYRSLVQAFTRHGVTPLVAELARVVAELDELAAARAAAPGDR